MKFGTDIYTNIADGCEFYDENPYLTASPDKNGQMRMF